MATVLLNAAQTPTNNVNISLMDIVENPRHQDTLIAAVDMPAGQIVYVDTAGKFAKADGLNSTKAKVYGVTIRSVIAGSGVTAIRAGILAGWDLSALAFGADVFASDVATIGTTAGTVSKIIGRVHPVRGQVPGAAPMKALLIEC